MMHKCLITLVVLCTALSIILDAAPTLPYTAGFETTRERQSDGMAKNICSKNLTTIARNKDSRDGSIPVLDRSKELMLSFLNFFGAVTSDERAESDPSDKTQQTLLDGFHTCSYFYDQKKNLW